MTTKTNKFRFPGQGNGGPTPRIPTSTGTRIVIDIDVTKGGSSLKTYGPLSIPMVIDVLLAQTTSLWAQWMKSMSTGLRGASGEPLFKTKADETPLAESPAEPTIETTTTDVEHEGEKVQ